MNPEHELAEALMDLAGALAADVGLDDFLRSVAARCAGLLEGEAAVLVASGDGVLRCATSSSDRVAALEAVQLEQREGPSWDAYRSTKQVGAERLEDCRERWPVLAHAALAAGARAAHAFPLRHRDHSLGTLDLFVASPGPLGEADTAAAQALADLATVGVVQDRVARERDEVVAQLQHALDARVVIEQAKGILVATAHVAPTDAFEALRRLARSRRMRVHEVARALIDETLATSSLNGGR